MSLIKKTLTPGVAHSKNVEGDHLFIEVAPDYLEIVVHRRGGDRATYVMGAGGGVNVGPYSRVDVTSKAGGLVEVQATKGQYTSNKVKIDPNNNAVSMAETVSVSIDEIGLTSTKNTIKIDPLNNAVDIAGQTVDISGQTVSIMGQVVDISGQTVVASGVDITGQTVDIAGQTVDVEGQELKVKPGGAASWSEVDVATEVAHPIVAASATRKLVTYCVEVDGRVWGDDTASDTRGFPVKAGQWVEHESESPVYFYPSAAVAGAKAWVKEVAK